MVVRRSMILPIAIAAFAIRLGAQASVPANPDQSLKIEIARMDSLLFAAFNARDLDRLGTFFAPDLEFYQDDEGLVNYSQTMKDFGAMFQQPSQIRRVLVPGSLEVYPIKDYGAIEVGSHRFCHEENGKPECGTFKFLHVWRKAGNSWRLSRIMSYAH
ncbi:MAG TPA: nuclear transport factor 2 family protein [Gemmatimonadaceae bacterium]